MGATEDRPDRRSVLLLGVGTGAALLSGCTLNNPYSSHKTPAAKAVRDLAPDVGVAVEAVALITAAQAEVEALIAAVPRYVDNMGGLRATYEAYAVALRGAVPKGVDATSTPAPQTPAPSPTFPGDAGVVVRRTATTVHAKLTGFALRAESGAFARLLGSMAAGLSQQLVVLR